MHFQDELTIDMTHFSGEGWGITEEEIDACKDRIREAALSVERLRKSGKGPDGSLVLFPHLPYLLEEEILISKEERERLLALSKLAKEQDIVVSIGIGGSYLGNQVLFDLFCGQYWNLMTKEERHGYPQLYFAKSGSGESSLAGGPYPAELADSVVEAQGAAGREFEVRDDFGAGHGRAGAA